MRFLTIALITILAGACALVDKPLTENQVRIIRDNFGVPHIYSPTVYGLYFGYGYSIAQDRLFQIEMARRSTQGTVAAVLGADFLDYDKNTRRHFDPGSIRRQLNELEEKDRDVFAGYAAGINAWLAEVRENPNTLLPKQFSDFDFEPGDWTGYDVAMIFIGTMNNRYGDFNTELENVEIYRTLTEIHGEQGLEIFNLLNPRFTDEAPATIPRNDWSRPAYDALANTSFEPDFLPAGSSAGDLVTTTGFSNCYVLGKDKVEGANAIIVNGPQFGWFNPAYVYSVGMHGAGIDVVGNTPFGYPMVMLGHNRTIAWGSTWGASDVVDLYGERLNPDDHGQYRYKGQYIDFAERVETIDVKDSDTVEYRVMRSVHGPVVEFDYDQGVVFAKKRAWDGRELENLLSWLHATWAEDFDEWKAQAAKSSINVNLYFADVDGNIGYFHGGHFPERVQGHDNRFPVVGDGSMDWGDRQSVDSANPHVLNPAGGVIANWNNKPGHGVMNPDFFFYSWSTADRVDFLHEALAAKERFSPDEAWDIIESSSYTDVNAPYFLPHIAIAAERSDDEYVKAANDVLQAWDMQSRDADGDGNYDEAATAIFRRFLAKFIESVFRDDLGNAYEYFSATGYPTAESPTGAGSNIQPGVKAIIEVLEGRSDVDLFNGRDPYNVMESVLQYLVANEGINDVAELYDLHLPVARRPFYTSNFLGIPQASEGELMLAPIEQNRGTENNMIVMQRDAIVGYEVTPPGQSGFVDQSGRKSEHYEDQFDLYTSFGRKRMWFYADDVRENQRSEIVLTY